MADKKTIGITSLITLGIVLSSMIVPTFFDAPKYYCEAESSIMECTALSGGSQTRCYLNDEKTSWDYCRSGWVEITNDLVIQEEPIQEPILLPEDIPNFSEGKRWLCSPESCVRIE